MTRSLRARAVFVKQFFAFSKKFFSKKIASNPAPTLQSPRICQAQKREASKKYLDGTQPALHKALRARSNASAKQCAKHCIPQKKSSKKASKASSPVHRNRVSIEDAKTPEVANGRQQIRNAGGMEMEDAFARAKRSGASGARGAKRVKRAERRSGESEEELSEWS